jgi:WD repeat and SOF domain-containing protein 1
MSSFESTFGLLTPLHRWKPFDPSRNWPDLGPRFLEGEMTIRSNLQAAVDTGIKEGEDGPDQRDLDWSAVLKRVMESYIRGERPNMYGELLEWSD